jgi:hypothetical protein
MLTYILLGAAALVVLLAIVVALQPSAFRIARTVKIAAPPSAIFPHINDMRAWLPWSPWEKLDPTMKRTYEGAASGVGSVYSWVGNKNVGEGRCTILESHPNELVRMKLQFLKPFKATNGAEFILAPEGNQTAVTWAMTGERNFMFKAMNLVMSMDKMCGGAFEQGLNDLKAVVEEQQPSRSEAGLVGAGA